MIDSASIDTTIYLGGVAIRQPVAVFTDYIITALAFYFYLHLNRLPNASTATIEWKRFFLLLSFGTFLGGCSHAFFQVHEGVGYKSFWLSMQALNIFSVYRAQQATLYSVLQNSEKKYYWSLSYRTQLILFVIAVFVFHNFWVVIIDSAIGLIPIMIIHFIDAKKVRSSIWIAYGISVLFLAAIVHITKFSFHTYFNYLDIGHVLIMINLSLMFIGIKKKAIS